METIAWISVYIVGYVVSYLWLRFVAKEEWTVRNRTIALLLSICSWSSVLLFIVVSAWEFISSCLKNESKAKW